VGDSFARAWKSLTPTEETVYSAIVEHVSENLRKHGFKRSHVENALEKDGATVSSTSVKDALKTLAGSGFLESDGKRGPTGATYTVAKSTNVAGSITLAKTENIEDGSPSGHSADSPKSGELGIGKASLMAGNDFGHSRPLAIREDERDSERPNCGSAIKSVLPTTNTPDFEGNGRMAEESADEKKTEASVDYEYSEDE